MLKYEYFFPGNFNLLLPTTVRDLIDLSGELSQSCVFEEVMTRSCPYKFTKECNPIFFIPGYSRKSLKSIFKRLMYPAFCATPVFYFESAETTALDLFQVHCFDFVKFFLLKLIFFSQLLLIF